MNDRIKKKTEKRQLSEKELEKVNGGYLYWVAARRTAVRAGVDLDIGNTDKNNENNRNRFYAP